jgi:hypothetical protein
MMNLTDVSPVPTFNWGVKKQPNPARPDATAPLEGSYVTPAGKPNALFVVENGTRKAIAPADAQSLGLTPDVIKEVNPLLLSALPVASTAGLRASQDLNAYLWSDLRSGHFMQSWVEFRGTTLAMTTLTETVTWFGGYTGGVALALFDGNGHRIHHDPIRYRYGIDGRFFGSGRREDTEYYELPGDVADAVGSS